MAIFIVHVHLDLWQILAILGIFCAVIWVIRDRRRRPK
jgi:hypothetical protein